jgi:hypothetical protein
VDQYDFIRTSYRVYGNKINETGGGDRFSLYRVRRGLAGVHYVVLVRGAEPCIEGSMFCGCHELVMELRDRDFQGFSIAESDQRRPVDGCSQPHPDPEDCRGGGISGVGSEAGCGGGFVSEWD